MSRLAPRLALLAVLVLVPLAAACDFDESGASPGPPGPPNRPPVATPDVATTEQGVPVLVDVVANDADPDGDPLTVAWVRSGEHESSIVGSQVRVAPDARFVGAITLEYGVFDGRDTTTGTATVTVRPGTRVNQPPVADETVVPAIDEDGAAAIELRGSDPDRDVLTFAITIPPAHGALSGAPPHLTYTPAPDYHGADGFVFTVSDGVATSGPRAVALRVSPVDDPPVPDDLTIGLDEDTSRAVTLSAVDGDGNLDGFRYEVLLSPSRGQLSGTPPHLIYTPGPDRHGSDSFSYWLVDGRGTTTASATVTIEIAPVDDPPTARPGSVTLREDATATIELGGGDVDGDVVGYELHGGPAHGTVTGTPPVVRYRPDRDFAGDDSFTFVVTARGATSAPARVALHIEPVDDPPLALPGAYATTEDTPVPVVLAAVDVDSELGPLAYRVTTEPTRGSLQGSGNELIYYPDPDAYGTDQLRFEISDGTATSSAIVTFAITPVNDAPRARDDIAIGGVDQELAIEVVRNDDDAEGDPFEVTVVSAPEHGAATVTDDGNVRYTPAAGFAGDDTFTYTVVDGEGAAATATVRVGVGAFPRHVPHQHIGAVGLQEALAAPSISRDGRLVAFLSSERLVDDDHNDLFDVYVYDRGSGTTERITTAVDGGDPDGHAGDPRISADGRRVAYWSVATNVVDGDDNGVTDVFVHDRDSGITVRVSVGDGGVEANGYSAGAEISADGAVVSFSSSADNLADSDSNGVPDVFVHDLTAGTTIRASVSASGAEANDSSLYAALSGNGRVVAFTSAASNLVDGDSNARGDVFVRDLATGTTERISVRSSGAQATAVSQGPSISHDGRYVGFQSYDRDLDFGCPAYCVFVRDRRARSTRLAADVPARAAQLSADGESLLLWQSRDYFTIRRLGGEPRLLGQSRVMPALSADGRYLAFGTDQDFGPYPPWSYYDIWVLPNPL